MAVSSFWEVLAPGLSCMIFFKDLYTFRDQNGGQSYTPGSLVCASVSESGVEEKLWGLWESGGRFWRAFRHISLGAFLGVASFENFDMQMLNELLFIFIAGFHFGVFQWLFVFQY